jgi:hypothetical protein
MKQTQANIARLNPAPPPSSNQLLTLEDLCHFKTELFFELRQVAKELTGSPCKQWLKSHEVRELLGMSPGTLQTLRNNGTMPFTKLGGVVYYNIDDIAKMMDDLKSSTF